MNSELVPLVYIIDSDKQLCDSLSLHLETCGYKTVSVYSTKEFLTRYSKTIPNCIIIDINLPEMGGLGLQSELIKRNIASPIIFMSSDSDFEKTARGFRLGAIDFIQKPIDVAELVVKLEESIQKNISMIDCCSEYNNSMNLIESLTNREKEVLELLVESMQHKKIAKILDISFRTVQTHISHIIMKTKLPISELVIQIAQSKTFIKLNPQYL